MSASAALAAFQRAPAPGVSRWYMGSLLTYLADTNETGGAYTLLDVVLKPGNEPPPHVHSREDELFYVVEGSFEVYVGRETFPVNEGGCVFLPRLKPHGFSIRSPQLHLLVLLTPGGIGEAFRVNSVPAQNLDRPPDAITYSTGDLGEAAQRLAQYGVRMLTADEVASQMPSYRNPTEAAS